MEGVVLQGVVVVVELRLGEARVHRGSRSREQPVDGEGIGGGVLHIFGFLEKCSKLNPHVYMGSGLVKLL